MKKASILRNARLFADLLIVLCSTRAATKSGIKGDIVQDSDGAAVADVAVNVSALNHGKVINIRTNRCAQYRAPSQRVAAFHSNASAPTIPAVKSRNVVFSVARGRRIDLSRNVREGNVTTIDAGDAERGSPRRRIG